MSTESAADVVAGCARQAQRAAPTLATASDQAIDAALDAMAQRLTGCAPQVLAANAADIAAAEQSGMTGALIDRLRLGEERLAEMAGQLVLLSRVPFPARDRVLEDRPDGLRLIERRRPVGVVGATFEARPNVTVDVASQLVKSRNAGVLRTGAAALRSALALCEHVIAPALTDAGLDPGAVQLVPDPRRDAAVALVQQPELIPLVIVYFGIGEIAKVVILFYASFFAGVIVMYEGIAQISPIYVRVARTLGATRLMLARHVALPLARPGLAVELLMAGLDRLGVCNRVNLLLVADSAPDRLYAALLEATRQHGIALSLPPHDHPLGHEWALDTGREATLTVSRVTGPRHAAQVANQETSGLAATIVTNDEIAANEFLDSYTGTGAFWNASTRLLDGFKLRRVPETGINVDRVPGPRGPVTFADLYLRQFVIIPTRRTCG